MRFAGVIFIIVVLLLLLSSETNAGRGRLPQGSVRVRQPPPVVNQSFWFTQLLDHFNPQDLRTWQQRVFVNSTWWNPSLPGPIFVNIGGEGPDSPYDVNYFQESNYAQRFGALLFSLEHRFYGASQPTGDISTASLKYLSSQQALADLAYFIDEITWLYNAQGAPVIVFGCSYAGALAAWIRIKYPHLAVGVVAGSAPVHAVADFYAYLDVVDQSLSYFTGAQCDAIISNATAAIQTMLQSSSGTSQLNSMFRLCAPLNTSNWLDVATFMSTLMGNFQGVVQYNDDNRLVRPPYDITQLCDMIIAGGATPLATYANVSNMFLQQQGLTCLDASYVDSLADLKNETIPNDSARQWVYQTCMEFGYYQTTDSSGQPFGNLVPLQYYAQMCQDAFNITFEKDRMDNTNTMYGSNTLPSTSATNILFVDGHIDPWHALSVTQDISDTVQLIMIEQGAHCSHEYPSSANDSPALIAARQQIEAQLQAWIAE